MTQIIDQLPLPVPSRTDPTNFSVRADNFLGELPDFATQVNALATELTALGNTVETNKNTAVTAANNAQASAFAATGSANNAASSSGAALWVSGTTYSLGNLVYSPITGRTYRRKIAGAGTTDPSADATNWIPIVLEISTQYPTIRPSLNLDFVNNKYLDPRITFTRSSTAKYFDGKTVHKAEENLLLQSETLENAVWVKTNCTITANSAISPFGSATSETLAEGTSASAHYVGTGQTSYVAGLPYTFSIYVKNVDRGFIQLSFYSASFGSNKYANFNVSSGSIPTTSGVTATIDHVGNSWYRCAITATCTTSTSADGAFVAMITSGTSVQQESYTGTNKALYVHGAQVEQRSSVGPYQATTTQPITNYQSTLVTASVNQPRFDHDPVTKECKGLLIEDATTNLLTYSEDFGNAAWTKSSSTVYSDFTYAPDGSKSADKLVEHATTAGHYISQSLSITASGSKKYSYSVYAKAKEKQYLQLIVTGGGLEPNEYANFDLQTGTLGTVGSSAEAVITHVGNGWYRCSISFTPISSSAGSAYLWLINAANSGRASSTTGNGYDGLYLWGAQLEDASASPSSYVATSGATASRSYDNAIMTGTNFSSWYNQEEGSVYSEVRVDQKPLAGYYNNNIFSIANGTTHLVEGLINTDYLPANNAFYNNAQQAALLNPTVYSFGTIFKQGISFSTNDIRVSNNSGSVLTDTDCILNKPMLTLDLGKRSAGVWLLRGHLRRFTYYPKKLTNQELQTLTAV